jgi:hypothetical protein
MFRRTQYLLSNFAKAEVRLLQSELSIQQFSIFQRQMESERVSFFLFSVPYQMLCRENNGFETLSKSKQQH